MGKPYSMDLRERVVAAVVKGGLSRRQAARAREKSPHRLRSLTVGGTTPPIQCSTLPDSSLCARVDGKHCVAGSGDQPSRANGG